MTETVGPTGMTKDELLYEYSITIERLKRGDALDNWDFVVLNDVQNRLSHLDSSAKEANQRAISP